MSAATATPAALDIFDTQVDTSQAIQPKILVESDAKMKILNSDQESFYRSAKPSGHYIQNTTEDRENTKSKMEFADIKTKKHSLMTLPEEIKLKIWILALSEEEPISPQQIKAKSNKFVWSKAQVPSRGRIQIAATPQLTAVQLSKVSHQMYEEVALTHLFYEHNVFDLASCHSEGAIDFLVAITDARLKAIKSVKVTINGWGCRQNARLYNLLRTCNGLQNLELVIDNRFHSSFQPETIDGLKDLVGLLHTTKSFSVTAPLDTNVNAWYLFHNRKPSKVLCKEIANFLKGQLEKHAAIPINISKLRQAQESANLDVHGEGRLGQDKKPGFISSRTRQGKQRSEILKPDGTVSKRIPSKYTVEGELTWTVHQVIGSREVSEDNGLPGLEFQVITGTEEGHLFQQHYKSSDTQTTWENLAVLTSIHARFAICEYIRTNPHDFETLDTITNWWKPRFNDEGGAVSRAYSNVASAWEKTKQHTKDEAEAAEKANEQVKKTSKRKTGDKSVANKTNKRRKLNG